ncbi:MAG: tRNA pseudouridine(55) synthase TruB [Clostridia bacterium]|nr:tRNA pseudouridine(55) synthase TruB [Clostridia bacterium]
MGEINGLVLLDKPEGFTSFKAAAVLRRIYKTKRVGHTGTLDPMATGVLPILIGKATRLCSLVLEADKRYTATVRLGVTTDSLDITGTVLSSCKPKVTDEQLNNAIANFIGEYDQSPPMFSAIQKNGVRLYELARRGEEIEREPRRVCIREINLLKRNGDDFVIDVVCSKGTYIRSLADDIGKFLGCGACLTALRRTKTAQFDISQCVTLEEIESAPEKYLLSPETAVDYLREIKLSEGQKKRFTNGGEISVDRVKTEVLKEGELFRMKFGEQFLGLAEYKSEKHSLFAKCVIER